MIAKLISLLAAFLMLFQFAFTPEPAKKESGDLLMENKPEYNELRVSDKIDGVDESRFYIERPSDKLNTVNASDFGMDASKADNFPSLKAAVNFCKSNPGTKLLFEKGTYYLNNTSSVSLNGLKDIMIDGGGATLIFSQVNIGFEISGCDCVEFRNIRFDWDWDKRPLSHIAVVRNASSGELDFVFPEDNNVDEKMIISAVSQCDPETLTYGAKYSNKEVYVYMDPSQIESVTKTAGNTLHIRHNGCFNNFKNGDTFIIRHYVYDTTFAVINGESKNITFDGVSLFGYPGAGFYAGDKANHFQIINSFIGTDPDGTHHTSLGADAIHIVNTNGCFNISGCDISGQGDDALNVHDGLGCIDSISGNTAMMTGNAILIRPGTRLGFRDEKFNETDITAVVESYEYNGASTQYKLNLNDGAAAKLKEGYIVYSLDIDSGNYAVRNNYFHENRARGLLLQSSNGICENNRFYKTEMQAIKIIMDISHGLWYEGTGVDRLTVRNNTFEMCDYISTGEVITVGTNIDGRSAVSQPFSNIVISGNTFTEFPGRVINADNVNGIDFSGNTIEPGKAMPKSALSAKAYFGKYSSNVVYSGNNWIGAPLCEAANAANAQIFARVNSQL